MFTVLEQGRAQNAFIKSFRRLSMVILICVRPRKPFVDPIDHAASSKQELVYLLNPKIS